jgi:hypothetical protein
MKMHDGEEIDGLGLKCRILCWAARSRKIWAHVGPCQTEIKINDRLVELYHREEVMWRQRSLIDWLSEGDKNSKFFHQRASMRRRKNLIKTLARDDGQLTDNDF